MRIGHLVIVIALAAGTPAAAQSRPKPPAADPAAQTPAQTPATQTPAGPPPPSVPASRKFTSDAGLMFSVIKPDKTADFEAVMARVKEALAKSDDPKRKQQALGWTLYKGLESGPGGNIVYVWVINPPIKDTEYVITDILREAFPNEAQDLWAKYHACFVSGQTMLNLQQVLSMSPVLVPK